MTAKGEEARGGNGGEVGRVRENGNLAVFVSVASSANLTQLIILSLSQSPAAPNSSSLLPALNTLSFLSLN